MLQLSSPTDLQNYDLWVKSHPDGSLWQSLEWKTYQETLGREVRIYVEGDPVTASALVVIDKTTFGWSTWDIPRGPLTAMSYEPLALNLLKAIEMEATTSKAMTLTLSPVKALTAQSLQLKASPRMEQPPATRLLNLRESEDQILTQMKQKGRYNIRVSEKHGVSIKKSDNIADLARLAAETALRDGFTAPPASQYQKFLESLPGAFLLLASSPSPACPSKPVRSGVGEESGVGAIAGLLGTTWNGTGIYYYGASDYKYRNLMAPYLLQWEAMKLCKAAGCHTYDLLGIARPLLEQSSPSSEGGGGRGGGGWAGISRFKEQFGGTIVEYPPEQQILLKPWASRVLKWKRKILG